MGIKDLSKLLNEQAPDCIKENEIKNFFGRKIAIDASMSIYQFLIAVRSEGANLMNESGETTSHLMGLFFRTVRMVKNGIKPVYVFDGKPPEMKSGELSKRTEKRAEAQKSLDKAKEDEDAEMTEKFSRRLVKVTKEHTSQCKELLKLMGVPFIEAPGEAEAQCARLAADGKVYATATEDMDALTFGTKILLRHMTFSEMRKMPIKEYRVEHVLEGLGMTMPQFIDLCILLGCDYCDKIGGIGYVNAFKLMKAHGSIEGVLKHIEGKKFKVPENWPYEEARRLFVEPDVTPSDKVDLKWTAPDVEALIEFMCKKHGFQEERIRGGAAKLTAARSGPQQGRLDSFFKVLPSAKPTGNLKRKGSDKGAAAKKSRGKPAKGKKK